MTKPSKLDLRHGVITYPAFLPDGTKAVVRSLDKNDLVTCGIQAVIMNTFHIMQNPGSSTIRNAGGLNSFSSWDLPIITDSGGFQIFSLIHQNPKKGQIRDKGAHFYSENGQEYKLTPEKSIQLQLNYQSDVVICLDDCTHVSGNLSEQKESVKRTVAWAKRCKSEFKKLTTSRDVPPPKLFAVIQGGGYFDLRKECANELLEIGFDGFGYGGWPLDDKGDLLTDILAYTREIVPQEFPMHALGVGHPVSVRDCYKLGYDLFDSALPTRDARRGRLYLLLESNVNYGSHWFDRLYIGDEKNVKNTRKIDEQCECYTCQNYSVSYLHHLSKINDSLFYRLASIHNLHMMTVLMESLRRIVK